MRLMRSWPLLIILLIGSRVACAAEAALPQDDTQSIRAVISAQLDAFSADDAETAFTFASKSIRETFGTAQNFMAMVKAQYPVVYHPASVRFLEPEQIDQEVIQPVELSDADGALWLAIYRMQRQPDNSWRIGGCLLKSVDGERT